MNPITGATVNSQFANAISDRLNVAGIAERQAINPSGDFSPGRLVTKPRHAV